MSARRSIFRYSYRLFGITLPHMATPPGGGKAAQPPLPPTRPGGREPPPTGKGQGGDPGRRHGGGRPEETNAASTAAARGGRGGGQMADCRKKPRQLRHDQRTPNTKAARPLPCPPLVGGPLSVSEARPRRYAHLLQPPNNKNHPLSLLWNGLSNSIYSKSV